MSELISKSSIGFWRTSGFYSICNISYLSSLKSVGIQNKLQNFKLFLKKYFNRQKYYAKTKNLFKKWI